MHKMRTDFTEHSISAELREAITSFMLKAFSSISNGNTTEQYDKKEIYAFEVSNRIGEITALLDRILLAIHVLENESASSPLEYISEGDLLSFNIENVLMRITSLFDRALHLVNQVLLLGIKNHQCRYIVVIKEGNLIGTDIHKALEMLQSEIHSFKSDRNAIAHEDTYSDKIISAINANERILVSGREDTSMVDTVNKLTDEYKDNKLKEFQHFYNMSSIWINDLFDALKPEIVERLNA